MRPRPKPQYRRMLAVAALALSLVAATSGTMGYRAGVRAAEAAAEATPVVSPSPEVVYRYVVVDPVPDDRADWRWTHRG